MKTKDIRIGDYVVIQKAGDVIPEIVRSLPSGAQVMSRFLPCLNSVRFQKKSCSVLRRSGSALCKLPASAQAYERLIHYASVEQ